MSNKKRSLADCDIVCINRVVCVCAFHDGSHERHCLQGQCVGMFNACGLDLVYKVHDLSVKPSIWRKADDCWTGGEEWWADGPLEHVAADSDIGFVPSGTYIWTIPVPFGGMQYYE